MDKTLESFKYFVAIIATCITWLFGAWSTAIAVLVSFVVLDWITGLIKAWYKKELSSDVGLKGIARKGVIFIVLIVAVLLDRLLNTGTWVFRTMVCYFYIANEGISILENVIALGLPVPEQLKNALVQLQNKEGK